MKGWAVSVRFRKGSRAIFVAGFGSHPRKPLVALYPIGTLPYRGCQPLYCGRIALCLQCVGQAHDDLKIIGIKTVQGGEVAYGRGVPLFQLDLGQSKTRDRTAGLDTVRLFIGLACGNQIAGIPFQSGQGIPEARCCGIMLGYKLELGTRRGKVTQAVQCDSQIKPCVGKIRRDGQSAAIGRDCTIYICLLYTSPSPRD